MMKEFLEVWGDIARNISLIVSGIGMLVSVIIYLNKLKDSVDKIPGLLNQTEEITDKVKDLTSKLDENNEELNMICKKLDKHCSDGNDKNLLIMDMARQVLLNEIETSIHQGWVSMNRKAVVGELYDAYRKNGGNGPIHQLWDIYMDLPIDKQ